MWIETEISTQVSRELFRKKWINGERTFEHVLHALSLCLIGKKFDSSYPRQKEQYSMSVYCAMHSAAHTSSINTQQPIGVWQDTTRALDRALHAALDELHQCPHICLGSTILQMFLFLHTLDLLHFVVTKDGGGSGKDMLTFSSSSSRSPSNATTPAERKMDIVQRTVHLLYRLSEKLVHDTIPSQIVLVAASAGYNLNKPVSISRVARVHLLSMCFPRCFDRIKVHSNRSSVFLVLAICIHFGIPLGTDLSVHGMIGDGDDTFLCAFLEGFLDNRSPRQEYVFVRDLGDDYTIPRAIARKDPEAITTKMILPLLQEILEPWIVSIFDNHHCHQDGGTTELASNSALPPPPLPPTLKYSPRLNTTSEVVLKMWSRLLKTLRYINPRSPSYNIQMRMRERIGTLMQVQSEQRAFDARLEIEKAFRCTTSPLRKLPYELCVYIGEMI